MSGQSAPSVSSRQYPCENCPLRSLPAFREFESQELSFISGFKKGELA
ncbi:Crp/Fnr family transcriptional regulator, partial [Mesorhizobium sp. VK3C]|nr:Crp/Fnr family transcriptional regulator [Mesorhizobium sp. VK3C]